MDKEKVLIAFDTKEDIVACLKYINSLKESKNLCFGSVKLPTEDGNEAHLQIIYDVFEYMGFNEIEHDINAMIVDDFSLNEFYGNIIKDVNEIFAAYNYFDHNIISFGLKLAFFVNLSKAIDVNTVVFGIDLEINEKQKTILNFFEENTEIKFLFYEIQNCEKELNELDLKSKFLKQFDLLKMDCGKNEKESDYNFNLFFNNYLKEKLIKVMNKKIDFK